MSEHRLKLYESSTSPHSRRVRIFLAEKAICIARVPVDLSAGEQHSAAYIQINPRRVVPTLVLEDGTAIGEVPAILRYLEETHPNTPLLGTSPKDKALVTMWERRMELEGFVPAIETIRNNAALSGRQRIANFYDVLEARLSDVPFVAGDRFSAADITATVAIDYAAQALNLPIPAQHAASQRWYALIAARPSMAA